MNGHPEIEIALGRIEERMRGIDERLSLLRTDVHDLKHELDSGFEKMDGRVRKQEIGQVGLAICFGALLALVTGKYIIPLF